MKKIQILLTETKKTSIFTVKACIVPVQDKNQPSQPTKYTLFDCLMNTYAKSGDMKTFLIKQERLTAFRVNGFSTTQFRGNASFIGLKYAYVVTPETRSQTISRVVVTVNYRPQANSSIHCADVSIDRLIYDLLLSHQLAPYCTMKLLMSIGFL